MKPIYSLLFLFLFVGMVSAANVFDTAVYPYKRLINFTGYGGDLNSIVILNLNVSSLIVDNKLDINGECLKFTDFAETKEIYAYTKYSKKLNGSGAVNLSKILVNVTVAGGNNNVWMRYGTTNPANCIDDVTLKKRETDASGLIRSNLFLNDTFNQSNLMDAIAPAYNFTRDNLNLTSNIGVGFSGNFTGRDRNIIESMPATFNNLASGSIVWLGNWSDYNNKIIVQRGYTVLANRDLQCSTNPAQTILCTLDAGATFLMTTALSLSTSYMAGFDWNSTEHMIYINGLKNATLTSALGLSNSAARPITIGGFNDLGTANLTGYVSFVLFFNNTLNASKHRLLNDYSLNTPYGDEQILQLKNCSWYNTNWSYRKEIPFISAGNQKYFDSSINITFDSKTPIDQSKMKIDCSDLIFTYCDRATGNQYVAPHFLYADESFYGSSIGACAGGSYSATAILKLPTIYNLINNSIYYYYGNPATSSANNPKAAMQLFDGWVSIFNQTIWKNGTDGAITPNGNCGSAYCYKTGINITLTNTGTYASIFGNSSIYNSTGLAINSSVLLFFARQYNTSGAAYTSRSLIANGNAWTLNLPRMTLTKIIYNATGTQCLYLNATGGACAVTAGTPASTAPTTINYDSIQGYAEIQNISMFNSPTYPFTFYSSLEEANGSYIYKKTNLIAYDLVTGDQIYFNVTFTNGTSSLTSPNTNNYTATSINLPKGSNTITVTNASYYDSIFYLVIADDTYLLSAMLNPKTNPNLIFVRFHIVSSGYTPIANANVLIQYISGATTYNVTSCVSDSSGTCGVYLDSSKTFLVSASATGYDSATSSINPTGSDYTISLTSSGAISYYPGSYYGVTYQLSPAILDAINNWTIINYTVKDMFSQLVAYGLNLTYNGVLIFNQTNSTPASGGTILVNFSSVGRVGNLTAIFYFQKSGYLPMVQTKSFTIYQNFTIMNWSLSAAMDRIRDEGKSPLMVMVAVLMVIAMAVGWVNRGMAIGAGTGVLAVLLLAFTFPLAKQSFNASEVLLLVVLGILAIALVRLRSGQ